MNYDLNTDTFNKQFLPPTKRTDINYAWGRVLLNGVQYVRDLFFDDYVQGNTDVKVINYSSVTAYTVGQLVYYETTNLIYECILNSTGNAPTNVTYFSPATFSVAERIIFSDKAVYECITDVTAGTSITNTTYWMKIQDKFLGLKERTLANSQILLFEYILNKWFGTGYNYPSTNDIYITNDNTNNNSFLFGVSESESSSIAATDTEQTAFIASSMVYVTNQFVIHIPVAVFNALRPLGTNNERESIVRSFADNYVLAGMTYTVVTY